MSLKLTRRQKEILVATAKSDCKDAFHANGPLYGQARRRRDETIRELMRLELLNPLIGPTFATITDAGLAAISTSVPGIEQR